MKNQNQTTAPAYAGYYTIPTSNDAVLELIDLAKQRGKIHEDIYKALFRDILREAFGQETCESRNGIFFVANINGVDVEYYAIYKSALLDEVGTN